VITNYASRSHELLFWTEPHLHARLFKETVQRFALDGFELLAGECDAIGCNSSVTLSKTTFHHNVKYLDRQSPRARMVVVERIRACCCGKGISPSSFRFHGSNERPKPIGANDNVCRYLPSIFGRDLLLAIDSLNNINNFGVGHDASSRAYGFL
jgi:hypothetical protein